MIHVKHLYFIESKYRTKNAGYKRVKLYEIISEEVVKRRPRLATILFLSGDEAPLAKEPLGSNLQILQWIATAKPSLQTVQSNIIRELHRCISGKPTFFCVFVRHC